jgi:hypothetical protein
LSNGLIVHGGASRAVGLLELHVTGIPLVFVLLSRREPFLDSVKHGELDGIWMLVAKGRVGGISRLYRREGRNNKKAPKPSRNKAA